MYSNIRGLAYTPDGQDLVVSCLGGVVRVFNLRVMESVGDVTISNIGWPAGNVRSGRPHFLRCGPRRRCTKLSRHSAFENEPVRANQSPLVATPSSRVVKNSPPNRNCFVESVLHMP